MADLQPGTYTAVLRAENMAGEDEGPGRWLWEDTKTFTVVPCTAQDAHLYCFEK